MFKPTPIVFLCLLFTTLVPQTSFAQTELNAPIPVDEKLTRGQLANGLNYYILPNQRPERKAELRLVVQAGSLHEQDDQRGFAHLLEHMAFNGTAHFPKQSLVDQLQRMGIKFGADLNAYTSFNETVYILPIPLNEPKNLQTGLQILEDWAFHMNLDDNAIQQEAAIVEEEWRISTQNPEARIADKNLAILLSGSGYPARQPIGDMNIVRYGNPQRLRDYYRTWYRPNLMSVIVVGDVDVNQTRTMIENHFSAPNNPSSPPVAPSTLVGQNTQPLIGIFKDKDLPKNSIWLTFKEHKDNHIDRTIEDYVTNLKHQLISIMMNQRLAALQDSTKPPFVRAYSMRGPLAGVARSKRAYTIGAQVADGQILASLKVLHTENQRLIEHGFTQAELDRAKHEYLAHVENNYNNRDKVESADKAEEYIRGVVEHEPLPSSAWEFETAQRYIPSFTLSNINQLVRTYFTTDNRIAIINTHQIDTRVNEQAVQSIINSRDKTSPPATQKDHQTLLKTQPAAGQIVHSQYDKTLDLTTWRLSNGATVRFKKTDFDDDKISFASYADGGYSQLSDDAWRKTQWVYGGLDEAGVNGYNNTQLKQILAGHLVTAQQYINEDSQGLTGEFALKDAETAFQLIYSRITSTNHDTAAYARYKQRMIAQTQNLERDRMSAFSDALMRRINHKNPRFTGTYPNAQAWQNMDYDAAYAFFQNSFRNANGMNFTFVGKIDEKQLKTLVERYIASLPSDLKTTSHFKDNGYRDDINGRRFEFKKGKENLSVVYIGFTGEAAYKADEALALRALGEILTIKLTEHLREVDGGVYSIGASGEMYARPFGKYSFTIQFPCAPNKADTLAQSAQRELEKLIQNGPEQIDVEKFKKAAQVSLREQLKNNGFWLSTLQTALKRGIDPNDIWNEEKRLQNLSAADIQNIGKKYLLGQAGVAILKPE